MLAGSRTGCQKAFGVCNAVEESRIGAKIIPMSKLELL